MGVVLNEYRCARCGGLSAMTGHFKAYCAMTGTIREFHFCCPENCEMEDTGH